MTSYLFRAGGATKYKIDNQPSQGCVALSLALVSSERGRGISGRFRGQIENGELPSRLSVPMLPLGLHLGARYNRGSRWIVAIMQRALPPPSSMVGRSSGTRCA